MRKTTTKESQVKKVRKYENAEEFSKYLLPKLKQYTKLVSGYANEGIILFDENRFFDRLARDFKMTRNQIKSIFPIKRNESIFGGKEGMMKVPKVEQLIDFYNQAIHIMRNNKIKMNKIIA